MFLPSYLATIALVPVGVILILASVVNYGRLVSRREYEKATFVLVWSVISAFLLGVAIAHELQKLENLLYFAGAILGALLSGP